MPDCASPPTQRKGIDRDTSILGPDANGPPPPRRPAGCEVLLRGTWLRTWSYVQRTVRSHGILRRLAAYLTDNNSQRAASASPPSNNKSRCAPLALSKKQCKIVARKRAPRGEPPSATNSTPRDPLPQHLGFRIIYRRREIKPMKSRPTLASVVISNSCSPRLHSVPPVEPVINPRESGRESRIFHGFCISFYITRAEGRPARFGL